MQKAIISIVFLFLFVPMQAQTDKHFYKIDRYAIKTPKSFTTSIPTLANYLTAPYQQDVEKVRSIFSWVVHHIEYDRVAYKNGNRRINKSNEDVLKRRKAVCYGYSTLLKALCEAANIPAEVVSGFSKGILTASDELGQPDHAWNAVKINGKWLLLDATWASGLKSGSDDFMTMLQTDYFLTAPNNLIINHLPMDPMWQLLNGIVTPDIFIKSSSDIKTYLDTTNQWFNYLDTLAKFEALKGLERRVSSERRAYYFHSIPSIATEYGHTLMDYQGELSEIETTLQGTAFIDSLIFIQKKMITLCEEATQLTQLFPNQVENCTYTRINYAVALSQKVASEPEKQRLEILKIMKMQTLQAQATLEKLPSNFAIEAALSNCEQILEYLK